MNATNVFLVSFAVIEYDALLQVEDGVNASPHQPSAVARQLPVRCAPARCSVVVRSMQRVTNSSKRSMILFAVGMNVIAARKWWVRGCAVEAWYIWQYDLLYTIECSHMIHICSLLIRQHNLLHRTVQTR